MTKTEIFTAGIVFFVVLFALGWFVHMSIWGKCPYCGSKQITHVYREKFYCNACKSMF